MINLAKIRIDSNGTNSLYSIMKAQSDEFSAIANLIKQADNNLDMQVSVRNGIDYHLGRTVSMAQKEQRNLKALADIASKAQTEFKRADRKLAGKSAEVGWVDAISVIDTLATDFNKHTGTNHTKDTLEINSTVADTILKEKNNVDPTVAWAAAIGSIGAVSGCIKSVKNEKYEQYDALSEIVGSLGEDGGLDMPGADAASKLISAVGNFSAGNYQEGVNDILKSGMETITMLGNSSNIITSTAKYGGWFLSGLTNFSENSKEFKYDYSNPKFWLEAVGETAVDIGIAVGVKAGIAAVAAMTAPGWAPVVVVAGGAWIVNKVVDLVFEKDLSECVVDVAGKIIDGAVEVTKKAVEVTNNAIKTTAKAVKAVAKNVDKAVKTTAKAVDKAVKNTAKAVDTTVKNTAKAVDKAVKTTAKTVDKTVKNVSKQVGKATKAVTKGLTSAWKSITKKKKK